MQKFKLKTLVAVILVGIAVAAGAFFYVSARKPAATPANAQAAPKPALTVTVAVPESVRLPIKLAANGNIAAWQEAVIGAESSGLRLTDVRVNVGDVVKAGQVLATFATDSVQADVARRTFYGYFPNKHSLLGGLGISRLYDQSEPMLRLLMTNHQTTRGRLEAMIDYIESNFAGYEDIDRQLILLAPSTSTTINALLSYHTLCSQLTAEESSEMDVTPEEDQDATTLKFSGMVAIKADAWPESAP